MKYFLFSTLLIFAFVAHGQPLQIKLDYEERPKLDTWYRDNKNLQFFLDENKKHQYNKSSNVCIHIRWDSIKINQRLVWFTDLKLDSLAGPSMEETRNAFGGNLWLSLWCNTGAGDSVWLQPLILTRGYKGKWASTKRIPVCTAKWVFVKFNLAGLQYTKWGEGPEVPDLKSGLIRCFEIGLLNGNNSPKGFIDFRFDDLMISNYEPVASSPRSLSSRTILKSGIPIN
jgi:hypothetical protein